MNTTGNIPGPSAPFLDADGRISQAWWQFMVSMFSRTGGGQGVDSLALLALVNAQQATISALQATIAGLQTQLAAAQKQVNAIPLPAGYSNVTAANTTRKIPYY